MSEVRPGNSGRADYPRMLYHKDGRMIIVHTPEEHNELMGSGWDTEPAETHKKVQATPSGYISSSDPLALLLKAAIREVLPEVMPAILEQYGMKRRS